MFSRILIANRGEIACRIIKTARRMGVETVAVYSDADAEALHVRMADVAVRIGPAPARESYLSIDAIVAACRESGAVAVHPGYGFLSENPAFAERLRQEGIFFIGPPVKAIRAMGDKLAARALAAEAGVSILPGSDGPVATVEEALAVAAAIGLPVMIKASAGGGGKGLRVATTPDEVVEGFDRARSEALSAFGDDRVFIEKYVTSPRHIEIQVLADALGNVVSLGERECSIQRRNQKVIEEAPSPLLDAATRAAMGAQAVALAKAAGYVSAGTVEFIADADRNFYFLEMNTRLQVEHPVTELVTGIDLVEVMLRIANGEPLGFTQEDVRLDGWAIESRIYAEDPYRGFLPSTGRLTRYVPPVEEGSTDLVIRNDTGVVEGQTISPHYDPMIAKLVTWAPTRAAAIEAMATALDRTELEGIGHNLPFLSAVMDHRRFREGRLSTGFIAEEYPDGFSGAELDGGTLTALAALACRAAYQTETRGFVGGRTLTTVPDAGERVVMIGRRRWSFSVPRAGDVHVLMTDRGRGITIEDGWHPGQRIASADIDGVMRHVKMDRVTGGFRMRYRGADFVARVMLPHVADLMARMPEKKPKDMGNLLVCPMPGQVIAIAVEEGAMVEAGQALAIVEAMKMENVLRAPRRARIARIATAVGAVLAVDAVIMEFEAA